MNTNRLSLKDYIIIYLIIFLIVAFLVGFFLGAKVMESELKSLSVNNNYQNTVYELDEIITFYEHIYTPITEWNKGVHNMDNKNGTFGEEKAKSLINNGELMKSSIDSYTFESQYLTESISYLKENLSITLYALDINKTDLLRTAFDQYLTSQKYFYQGIWAWEQTSDKDNNNFNTNTNISWDEWNNAGLNQKNYIIALILEKNSINTFSRPEDITVHIDAYYQTNNKKPIDLEDLVSLLIASHAIQDKDFQKYKDSYSGLIPNIYNLK